MHLQLKKFGTTLTSRQAGREALAAIEPILADMKHDDVLEIDFDGVITFTPSWADEVLTPLRERYGDRLRFHASDNASVVTTLKFLEDTRQA